ncbi:MAG: hypothetical protein VX284_00465 [Candidatus Neomarinimicrobiota bacterium]|nr:hypothetical protein [Candidatus Neomarinimicrobiota bacterium]
MASVVIQRTLLLHLAVLFLISGCTDYKFGQLDFLPQTNIKTALDNLTVLIPHRYKERITRRYTDGSPAIIRTYDIMYNDLKKEMRYHQTGSLRHEAIYTNGTIAPYNSAIWWYPNGNRASLLVIDDDFNMVQGTIWYESGQIQFHFEDDDYYWWNEAGRIYRKGTLIDSSWSLPVWSYRGRFIGTRHLTQLENRFWIEKWVLFDNDLQPAITGNVTCSMRDSSIVDRIINEEWSLLDSAKSVVELQIAAQRLLNSIHGGTHFVTGSDWYLNDGVDLLEPINGLGGNESFISFIGGEPSKYFKGRQFNQNYYLEFFPDGYFTHLWYGHYTDSGYFRISPSGNRIFLHYESGIYSGESHVIDIINYRKIHYRFRNCSYFIAPKRN